MFFFIGMNVCILFVMCGRTLDFNSSITPIVPIKKIHLFLLYTEKFTDRFLCNSEPIFNQIQPKFKVLVLGLWYTFLQTFMKIGAILFDISWRQADKLTTRGKNISIGSSPTILYFDLYLYSAYATHYVSI